VQWDDRFQVIFRDDAVKPGDAIRHAEELPILGGKLSYWPAGFYFERSPRFCRIFALQRKSSVCLRGFASGDAHCVGGKVTALRFSYRDRRPSMQAGMAAEAAAKLPAKRWATLAPNYEDGNIPTWAAFQG